MPPSKNNPPVPSLSSGCCFTAALLPAYRPTISNVSSPPHALTLCNSERSCFALACSSFNCSKL
ncbi:hypothetical protein BJY04DRAFT_6489 [Aspergillus karnatakaensis]|uniref:uncharacterized protein n=1 Tax=Aspergillus karnatakaensis TaxID=1810916 RepID=UPI003CCD669E